jgi:hypothetical protein
MHTKSSHNGYSVMVFGNDTGKVVQEGVLRESFFNNYNQLKNQFDINVGWELINNKLYPN